LNFALRAAIKPMKKRFTTGNRGPATQNANGLNFCFRLAPPWEWLTAIADISADGQFPIPNWELRTVRVNLVSDPPSSLG
jgi:hypothetical protein